ncbi:metalloregulator ArsR/SmtB family transcription factor [Sphaerochaeta halotolerans]|nr:metalloregulator ArsR/SmtB family transcription factor [Sphaerochaeta halotolerans]
MVILVCIDPRRCPMEEFVLPLDEEIVDIADFFKVFGDPTRLKILFLLEQGERGVNAISEELKMQQSTISQQLKLLRARRLVRFRKDGRNVLYRLNDEHIHDILAMGIEHYQELL